VYQDKWCAFQQSEVMLPIIINGTPGKSGVSMRLPKDDDSNTRNLHPDTGFIYLKKLSDQLSEINSSISNKVEGQLAAIPVKNS
jgi:hypothetical protein